MLWFKLSSGHRMRIGAGAGTVWLKPSSRHRTRIVAGTITGTVGFKPSSRHRTKIWAGTITINNRSAQIYNMTGTRLNTGHRARMGTIEFKHKSWMRNIRILGSFKNGNGKRNMAFHFVFRPIIPLITLAVLVPTTTDVAELVATTTCHVVTSLIFVHPVFTFGTLLGSHFTCPLKQLIILGKLLIVDINCFPAHFFLLLCLLNLFTSVFNVVNHFTPEAVLNTTWAAEEVCLCLIVLDKHIVTPFGHALHQVGVGVSNLFPLKFLTPLHLLMWQKLFQIWKRDWNFAAGFGA